jgi:CDP-glucose 4,6-dehydratase
VGVRQGALEVLVVSATPQRAFWQGRRVFLTGHTGFKGSWLALWLQSMGAVVRGYALTAPTTPALFELARVADGMESHIGDLRDAAALRASLVDFEPEVVIHMAAQPLVRYSYVEPVETYQTNVMGTVHLLEAVRACSCVRAVVNVTTDKCYENREWPWGYRESEPMGGHDPYSSSKGCAELVTAAYRRSFMASSGVGLASGRAGNVIGGGDWAADRLVPDILRAFERGEAVQVRNPASIRPWQHVLEPLGGYLVLAEHLVEHGQAAAEGWNFGPSDDDARPVDWIVRRMSQAWGDGAQWRVDAGEHPHEAQYLKLDCSKARQRLHWQPRWGLAETLERIVKWHKGWIAGADVRALSLAEIAAFAATQPGVPGLLDTPAATGA